MSTVYIGDLDKASVLAALYNVAKPQGMGFLHYDPAPMSNEEAKELLGQKYFDYLKGRVMKISLESDESFDASLFDRDNGNGCAQAAIDSLRRSGLSNSVDIQAEHHVNMKDSLHTLREKLDEPTEVGNNFIRLGFSDVAEYLKPILDDLDEE